MAELGRFYAGDRFYVIEDGTFLVYNAAGEELARVSKGSCFGELALLRQVRPCSSCIPLPSHPFFASTYIHTMTHPWLEAVAAALTGETG